MLSAAVAGASLAVSPNVFFEELEAGARETRPVLLENTGTEAVAWTARVRHDPVPGDPGSARRDAFGYAWRDSQDAAGPEVVWRSIVDEGEVLALDDDDSVLLDLPFAFPFYGERHTQVRLSSNGYLTFGLEGAATLPHTLPDPREPNHLIAGFWADLDPSAGGTIHVAAAPDGQSWTVQFTEVAVFNSSQRETFQMTLFASGDFRFHYQNVFEVGAENTFPVRVGWENTDGTDGRTIVASAGFDRAGRVFEVRSPEWLRVEPTSGTLAVGASSELTLHIDATHLNEGTHTAEILLSGFGLPPVPVPVTLQVSGEAALAWSPADSLDFGAVRVGATGVAAITLANTGSRPLALEAAVSADPAVFHAGALPGPIAPGAAALLAVTFHPDATGSFASTLAILSDAANAPVLTIDLAGEGVPAPVIDVDTSPVVLTLPAGDEATVTLDLSNLGEAPLRWRTFIEENNAGAPIATATFADTAPTSATATTHTIDWEAAHVPGRLIVKHRPPPPGAMAPLSADGGLDLPGVEAREVTSLGHGKSLWVFESPVLAPLSADGAKASAAPVDLRAIADALNAREDIAYAHPDYILTSLQASPGERRFPDDPFFGNLWGLHNTGQTGGLSGADIDAPEAWTYTTGSAEVTVAVIDTGVDYTHPDLAANMWFNPGEIAGNGLDDNGSGFIDDVHGYDFVNNRGSPMDDHNHGTHCAGTIAAVGDNALGITGVAWEARIMALKFLDSRGSGVLSDAVRAIDYAIAHGAHIINASFGGPGFAPALEEAIARAGEAGILFVAAAGNSSNDNAVTPMYPAAYDLPNLIAVAATNHLDERAPFSNYGQTTVHLGAPGQAIFSTVRNAGYQNMSGTSMAAPHVAGAAALLLARNPRLRPEEMIDILMRTTDPLPSLAETTISGGRLNVRAALEATLPPWIVVEPPSGELAPFRAESLVLRFFSRRLESGGDLAGTLRLISDDPLRPVVEIPLQLHVEDAPGWYAVREAVDFGSFYLGGRADQIFAVENAGNLPLVIHSAEAPPGFSVLTPLPFTLAPGEVRGLALRAQPATVGSHGGTFRLHTNDPTDALVEIALSAEALPAPVLGLSADRVETDLFSGDRVVETLTLTNTGASPLVYTLEDLPAWLGAEGLTGEIAPGARIDIPFTFEAEALGAGTRLHGFRLLSDDPLKPATTLLARMVVRDGAGLRVEPVDTLDFGLTYRGIPVERTVTLRNAGNESLTISGDTFTDAHWSLSAPLPSSLSPGQSIGRVLTFTAPAPGLRTGEWRVSSNDPSDPVTVLALAASVLEAPAASLTEPAGGLHLALLHGETDTRTLTLHNTGPGELRATIAIQPAEGTDDWAFGAPFFVESSRAKTGDPDAVGALFHDNHFYVTGMNRIAGIPQVYVFDYDRNFLRRFPMPGVPRGGHGGRDLAWDGSALVAGTNTGLVRFDIFGNQLGFIPKPADLPVVRGVTYDPATDHFWVADVHSDIFEINRGGQVINRIRHDLWGLYGLAWDDVSEGGPFLWVAEVEELPARRISQIDPRSLEFTGFSFALGEAGWLNGIFLTPDYLPGTIALGGIFQAVEANFFLLDIGRRAQWLGADRLALTVPPGGSAPIDLTFDAGNAFGGLHEATIIVSTNDPAQPELSLGASLHITGTPRVEADATTVVADPPPFAHEPRRLSLRIRNEGTDDLEIHGVTSSLPEFTVITPATNRLAPRESVLIEADFLSSVPGSFHAVVTVATNDPHTPALDLHFSAEAIAPPEADWDTGPLTLTVHAGDRHAFDELLANHGLADLAYFIEWIDTTAAPMSRMADASEPSSVLSFLADPPTPASRAAEAGEPGPDNPAGELWTYEYGAFDFLARRNLPFFEGFESGRWTDWYSGFGSGKRQVTSQTAADGNFSFRHYGQATNTHRRGIHQLFNFVHPTTVRFHVRAGSTAANDAMVSITDDNGAELAFFYASAQGVFIVNPGATGHGSFPYEANRWYEITLRNINWTQRTFDYYIDGLLVKAGLPFRNPAFTGGVAGLYLYAFEAGSSAWFDSVFLSDSTVDWVYALEPAGSLAAQSARTLAAEVDATYRAPGTHHLRAILTTNDPLRPVFERDMSIEILDAPGILTPATAYAFGGLEAGGTRTLTTRVANAGSQPLVISGADLDHPAFSLATALPATLAPGEWLVLEINFAPSTIGSHTAHLRLFSNDPTDPEYVLTLGGEGLTPPVIVLDDTPLAFTLAHGESLETVLALANGGGGDLRWHAAFHAANDGPPAAAEVRSLLPNRAPGPDHGGYTVRSSKEDGGPHGTGVPSPPPKVATAPNSPP